MADLNLCAKCTILCGAAATRTTGTARQKCTADNICPSSQQATSVSNFDSSQHTLQPNLRFPKAYYVVGQPVFLWKATLDWGRYSSSVLFLLFRD